MTSKFITMFQPGVRNVAPDDKQTLGGKGASLLAMCHAGLPVPPGFVIHTDCCRQALENNGKWPDGLEAELRDHVGRLEAVTGRKLGDARNPLLVSVRSGAAVSMPGMMDTILNCGLQPAADGENPAGFWTVYAQFIRMLGRSVAGIAGEDFEAAVASVADARGVPPAEFGEVDCEALAAEFTALYAKHAGTPSPATAWDALVACIDAVFRSWNSDRAIAYRKQNSIRGLPGTAVTVQAMFPSRCSGIVFTVNPADHSDGAMVIESSYGLGEAVVSGDVKPDSFVVDRETLEVRERRLGSKVSSVRALGDQTEHDPTVFSLSDDQCRELAALSLRVEAFAGAPVDLEWGWADGEFALLQWRPIRGLEVARDVEPARQEEVSRLRALSRDRSKVWARHNVAETLPHPTPLTWDVIRRFMSGDGGFGRMYRDFGYRPGRRVREEGFLELICGSPYADVERVSGLFWDGMPLSYDLDAVREDPGALQSPPTRFDPNRTDAGFLLRLPRTIVAMIKSARAMKRLRKVVARRFDQQIVPPYVDYVRTERQTDLPALSTPDLLALLEARQTRVLDEFGGESLKPGFFGGMACVRLESLLKEILGTQLGERTTVELIGGLDGDLTLEQDQMLYDAAHGKTDMAAFLEEYGHRAVAEMELASPRWREDPSYLDKITALHRREGERPPMAMHEENRRKRQAAEARLPELLAANGAASLEADVRQQLAEAQQLLPYRENGKHYLMMGYELIRQVIVELGRRWELDEKVFYLKLMELPEFEHKAEQLRQTIARRRIRWQALRRLELPELIDSQELEDLGKPRVYETADELTGEAVSAGVFTGLARIVYDPRESRDLGTGYVLVCPSTDPAWTVLFMDAGGVIVEHGGVLSHGAIVARDFGIPAVVCADATRRLRDGERIKVDGNAGRVIRMDEPACEEGD